MKINRLQPESNQFWFIWKWSEYIRYLCTVPTDKADLQAPLWGLWWLLWHWGSDLHLECGISVYSIHWQGGSAGSGVGSTVAAVTLRLWLTWNVVSLCTVSTDKVDLQVQVWGLQWLLWHWCSDWRWWHQTCWSSGLNSWCAVVEWRVEDPEAPEALHPS